MAPSSTPKTTAPPTLEQIFFSFWHLLNATRPAVPDQSLELMSAMGLTVPQLITLHLLRAEPRSVSQIAEQTNLSRPAASHLVDRLVAMELVHRVEDPDDRRLKQVSLAASAAKMIDRLVNAKHEHVRSILDRLTPKTRAALAEALSAAERELRAAEERR